jgi:hypothetical protein
VFWECAIRTSALSNHGGGQFAFDDSGTLNPHPTAVSDTLFRENPFFDSKDLLQVRYELLRWSDSMRLFE